VENAFLNYVKGFDQNEVQIVRKREHTLRTASVAEDIAKNLGLDDENVCLARTIAVLHDFARFEQWTRYKTFTDLRSVDHGDLACELLFEKGHIDKFKIDPKYYSVIKFAVKNHNKFKIDTSNVPKGKNIDALLHAQIIRDADKCDIAWQIKFSDPRFFLLTGTDRAGGISPHVLDAIKHNKQIEHSIYKTQADSVVGLLSHALDLYTVPAVKIFLKNKYPYAVYNLYKNQLPKSDAKIIRGLVRGVVKFLRKQLKSRTSA
jgi:hypothetical protein